MYIKKMFKMKVIGTKIEDISDCLFDHYSLIHFIVGLISYISSFYVLITFMELNDSCWIAFVCIFVGSVIWELSENSFLIPIKTNKRKDDVINSQTDTLCIFLGGVIGMIFRFELWVVMFIIVVGILSIATINLRMFLISRNEKENM